LHELTRNPQEIRCEDYAANHLPSDIRVYMELGKGAICPSCGFVAGIPMGDGKICERCGRVAFFRKFCR
jgi:anaerobic ribonucleoside-triphosphate reductase